MVFTGMVCWTASGWVAPAHHQAYRMQGLVTFHIPELYSIWGGGAIWSSDEVLSKSA